MNPLRWLLSQKLSVLAIALMAAGCVSSIPPSAVDPSKEAKVTKDPGAMSRIGDAAATRGDRDTALTFYRRAADLRPNDVDAQLTYSRALAAEGDINEATEVLRLAYSKLSGNVSLDAAFAKLLMSSHRPKEAVLVFEDGLRDHPRDAVLLIGLGVGLDSTARHTEAQAAYQRALTVEPDSIAARNDLGLSLALAGRYDVAIETLRPLRAELIASDRSEDAAAVDGNLALAYGLMGDLSAAASLNHLSLPQDQVASNARFYAEVRGGFRQRPMDEAAPPPDEAVPDPAP